MIHRLLIAAAIGTTVSCGAFAQALPKHQFKVIGLNGPTVASIVDEVPFWRETITKASNGSIRILKEHCDMFLNHPNRNEKLSKAITDLYSRRSAIIHGKLPMAFKFCEDESYPEVEKAMQKVWYLDEATPIFIATLQKMAELNIHELEFGWRPKKKAK